MWTSHKTLLSHLSCHWKGSHFRTFIPVVTTSNLRSGRTSLQQTYFRAVDRRSGIAESIWRNIGILLARAAQQDGAHLMKRHLANERALTTRLLEPQSRATCVTRCCSWSGKHTAAAGSGLSALLVRSFPCHIGLTPVARHARWRHRLMATLLK